MYRPPLATLLILTYPLTCVWYAGCAKLPASLHGRSMRPCSEEKTETTEDQVRSMTVLNSDQTVCVNTASERLKHLMSSSRERDTVRTRKSEGQHENSQAESESASMENKTNLGLFVKGRQHLDPSNHVRQKTGRFAGINQLLVAKGDVGKSSAWIDDDKIRAMRPAFEDDKLAYRSWSPSPELVIPSEIILDDDMLLDDPNVEVPPQVIGPCTDTFEQLVDKITRRTRHYCTYEEIDHLLMQQHYRDATAKQVGSETPHVVCSEKREVKIAPRLSDQESFMVSGEKCWVRDREALWPVIQAARESLHIALAKNLAPQSYKKLLACLGGLPYTAWKNELGTCLTKAKKAGEEERVNYLIKNIDQKSRNNLFSLSPRQVRAQYDFVWEQFYTPTFCSKPIASWSEMDVRRWCANKRRIGRMNSGQYIAVVMRAVQLHYKFLPRDTQILTLLLLMSKRADRTALAQVNTGEGKSVIIAMLAAYCAMCGQFVDVVTSSVELASRDAEESAGFFDLLDLEVAWNRDKEKLISETYDANVVYGIAKDFKGDILRSSPVLQEESHVEACRPLSRTFENSTVIVDEVDNVVIDNRRSFVYLGKPIPSFSQLGGCFIALWAEMGKIDRCLIRDSGNTYFIDPAKVDSEKLAQGQIEDREKQRLIREHGERVEDLSQFVQKKLMVYLMGGAVEPSDEDSASRGRAEESLYSTVPVHLRPYVAKQAECWVRNAVRAFFYYRRGRHYAVEVRNGEAKIVPISHASTGVFEYDLVWMNGLVQFLQLKEHLPLKEEELAPVFLSIPGYMKYYKSNMYGFTGTLGSELAQNFLSEAYGADLLTIPPYYYHNTNLQGMYVCDALDSIVTHGKEEWFQQILKTNLNELSKGRSVLIICEYCDEVTRLKKLFSEAYPPDKIFTYTKQNTLRKSKMDCGDLLIGTNIAGRGTDLTTSDAVEDHGGMHVCITFLPPNSRVERQNAGRTARQGRKGTVQLVLLTPELDSIEQMREIRNTRELAEMKRASQDVAEMLCRDALFEKFSKLLLDAKNGSLREVDIEKIFNKKSAWKEIECVKRGARGVKGRRVVKKVYCGSPLMDVNTLKVKKLSSEPYDWGVWEHKDAVMQFGLWLKLNDKLLSKNNQRAITKAYTAFEDDMILRIKDNDIILNPAFYLCKGNLHADNLFWSNNSVALCCNRAKCKAFSSFEKAVRCSDNTDPIAYYNAAQTFIYHLCAKPCSSQVCKKQAYSYLEASKNIIRERTLPDLDRRLVLSNRIDQPRSQIRRIEDQINLWGYLAYKIEQSQSVLQLSNPNSVLYCKLNPLEEAWPAPLRDRPLPPELANFEEQVRSLMVRKAVNERFRARLVHEQGPALSAEIDTWVEENMDDITGGNLSRDSIMEEDSRRFGDCREPTRKVFKGLEAVGLRSILTLKDCN